MLALPLYSKLLMIVQISSSVIPVFAIDLVSNMYARSTRVVLSMNTTRRLLRSVLKAYGFENKSRTLPTGRFLLPSHQILFIIMAGCEYSVAIVCS
jgi:hypothetical protein